MEISLKLQELNTEVYYIHKELFVVISRNTLKHYLEEGNRQITYQIYKAEPSKTSSNFITPNSERYIFTVTDIPFSDEWETIVINDLSLPYREWFEIYADQNSKLCNYNGELHTKALKNIQFINTLKARNINIFK